ncbi:MAG: class I SAM-dependent methyltransferase [Candidatus Thermoplasmatota archaeon]|nr:class I SAM-dependent methyltransferase [Candidatus Thermoplasmatota archaeon]
MPDKPFSESCVQNRDPILAVLREWFADRSRVLEIGSGTGQHAVYFGAELPHLVWQTADVPQHHAGIRLWLAEAALPNVLPPLALDVNDASWRSGRYDAVFSANTLHIMGWPEVERFFAGVGEVLEPGGVLAVYGPFNTNGAYTSDSNARFDAWLKARDPASGVRDFVAVDVLARAQGLVLQQDIAMPANNRTLVWRMA